MGGILDLGQVVGPQGKQGPKGDPGQQGIQGVQGNPGTPGITPNIQVGTVTTLPPGSDAYFTRQEDSPDAAPVFDVGLPRGADSVNDGDMKAAMYDPTGKEQDVFAYADNKANSAETNAKKYAYSKEQSLSAETAALYGKDETAVPDDILAAIRPLITQAQNTASQKARVSVGTYTGTGTASQTINVGFGLKAVLVLRDGIYITVKLNEEQLWGGLAVIGNPVIKYTAEAISITSSSFVVFYDKSKNIFSNASNSKYYYVAIG